MSPSADRRRLLTIREALGAAEAFDSAHWLLGALPVALLVVVHELAIPGATAGQILVSVIAQQLATAVVSLPLGAALHRSGATLPLLPAFAVYSAIGAARAGAGALVAMAFGHSPDVGSRLLFWLGVAWVWMPLAGAFLTQLAVRRALLGALTETETAQEDARVRAQRTGEEIRSQLLYSVSGAVFSAVREIREALGRVTGGASGLPDADAMARIGDRLSALTALVGSTVDRAAEPPTAPAPRRAEVPAPLAVALDFEWRRPVQWAGASGLALLAVALPIALHAGRPQLAVNLAVALTGASIALALGPGIAGPASRGIGPLRFVPLRYLASAAVGSLLLLALDWDHLEAFELLLIAVLPLGLFYSAALLSGAMGCAGANRALFGTIGLAEARRADSDASAREQEERAREGLRAVLHGPIQGRLAACAMAVNFHAAGAEPRDGEAVARAVLDHLALVEQDLATLGSELLPAAGVLPAGAR
ncbi:MAG: iron-regulated transporter [Naasia sp.]|nr:iron-regulated transporter [Naasia sp.]